MNGRAVELHVLRYNPETDSEPRWQHTPFHITRNGSFSTHSITSRRTRSDAVVPVVMSHGRVWQLRDDGERGTQAFMQGVPA